MSDCQYFDVAVAKDVGVNAAIIFKSFCFWIQKNASEKENFKDGEYWAYASAKGLETYFPYFTARQIAYAIEQLVEKKYLKKAQLCDNKTNRTMWYALDTNGKCIFQIRQMHSTNLSNGSNKNVKSNIEDREKKIEKEDISTSLRSVDKRKRATRLPADWQPDISDIEYLRSKRPDLIADDVAERFRNYWCSKAGRDATKLDWHATWRNWVLNERQQYRPPDRKQDDILDWVRKPSGSSFIDITPSGDKPCLKIL